MAQIKCRDCSIPKNKNAPWANAGTNLPNYRKMCAYTLNAYPPISSAQHAERMAHCMNGKTSPPIPCESCQLGYATAIQPCSQNQNGGCINNNFTAYEKRGHLPDLP